MIDTSDSDNESEYSCESTEDEVETSDQTSSDNKAEKFCQVLQIFNSKMAYGVWSKTTKTLSSPAASNNSKTPKN